MALLLGIDIGTTGTKTLLIDEAGRVVDSASAEYPLLSPRPGWAEQDPEEWWNAAVATIRELAGRGMEPAEVTAVGLSGQMHGLVSLDAEGSVIRPAILWCDQRTVAECEQIEATIGPERLVELVSNPALAGFTAPKILWMKNREPELYAGMRAFLLPKDYVRYRMTGEMATEISDAAGTLLVDVKKGAWSEEAISELGIDRGIFPCIAGSADVCGKISAEAARATGLAEGTPVAGGGADNTCAAVGTGIVEAGRVSSSIGSSGVIFAHTDTPLADPLTRVHTFNHSVPGCWYLMGVMLSAGLSFRWFRDTFAEREMESEEEGGPDAYEVLSGLAEHAPPACEGLLFLPYLNGERTPHKDPYARGVFCGISGRHGRAHMVRSVMEGIVYGLKDSLDIIESIGIEVAQVRATGGGGKNAFWRQMQADVFGRQVVTVNHDEGPAFGAALLAGTAAGVYGGVAEAAAKTVKITGETQPREEMTAAYGKAHSRFAELYAALKETFRKNYGAADE